MRYKTYDKGDCNMPTLNGQEITYCVYAGFQYYENYGAHSWDGKGECPQYWKAKGGHWVLMADGITSDMINENEFMAVLQDKAVEKHQFGDEYVEYWFNGLELKVSNQLTPDEELEAEMLDWEYGEHDKTESWVDSNSFECHDRFMDMAESLGFEA